MTITIVGVIIGFSLSFMLGLAFTLVLKKNHLVFFIFMTCFIALFVYAGVMELWMFILSFVITALLVFFNIFSSKGGGE